jgi:RNA polymerase sigma-70 factor (ECF subfamily)
MSAPRSAHNPENASAAQPAARGPGGLAADERALVARVRAGDEAAFELLFRAHYGSLCTYAASMVGTREDAEELVQDLWTTIWVQREHWPVRESIAAYLVRAVRNRALGRLRHGRVTEQWQHDAASGVRPTLMGTLGATDPHAAFVEAEGLAAFARGVAELPERCRQVFLLRQRGLSHGEIAEIMGIRRATVEVQLWKALRALRRRMAPWSEP